MNVYIAQVDHIDIDRSVWGPCLAKDELAQVARLHSEAGQRLIFCAHALKRKVLAQCCGLEPQQLRFRYSEYGKPAIENDDQWQFNLSHSNGWVALAVRQQVPVGVDIEVQRDRKDVQGLAERFFSQSEADLLRACDDAERQSLFYQLWVAKEAILKAHGVGIAHYLNQVRLNVQDTQVRIESLPESFGDDQNWHLQILIPAKNTLLAIASPAPVTEVNLFPVKQL